MKRDLKDSNNTPIDRTEFEILRRNRTVIEEEFSLDDYIRFLTDFNRFANHPMKKKAPMKGDRFML